MDVVSKLISHVAMFIYAIHSAMSSAFEWFARSRQQSDESMARSPAGLRFLSLSIESGGMTRTTERSWSLFVNSDGEKHAIECPQPDQDMCTGSPTSISRYRHHLWIWTEFGGSQNPDYS
ncbi:hypothetical protein ARMSODRAFT_80284 [Armillaria solidipes]|uniref:Uncharacterized protein n=1 Tax=Armillaria solidipes TaxID=1076256 RepID=A0A2H3AJ93_9AGAR|nr:hypothetical protein ARMSODRAFT_80284 [Armillaria solidipes]